MGKYYTDIGKTVTQGETANASDLNNVNTAVDAGFDLVESDFTTLESNTTDWSALARAWAENAQASMPDEANYPGKYSSRANAIEAQDWASASDGDFITGDTINHAEGGSTLFPSAKTSADYAKLQADNAAISATNAATSETNAAASESAAEGYADALATITEPTVPVDNVFTATASQVDFDMTPYVTGSLYEPSVMVWMNGTKLVLDVDYTVSGNVISLTTGASVGDLIDIHAGGLGSGPDPTGLEIITEGSNTGWRLVGTDPTHYGDIGNFAVDISTSPSTSSTKGATGNYSFSTSYNSTSSGGYSACVGGQNNTASNTYSVVLGGAANTASGDTSACLGGALNVASFDLTTCIGGQNQITGRFGQTVMGQYNEGKSDTLFEIGNGYFDSPPVRFNVFEISDTGVCAAPSATVAEIDTYGDTSLITKEYLDNILVNYGETVLPPATASSTGTAGQFAYDSSYFYVCIATDTWVRTPLSTW